MRSAARYALCFVAASLVGGVAFPLISSLSERLAAGWEGASEAMLRALTESGGTGRAASSQAVPQRTLQPSVCQIDPVLASLEARDPIEDARASLARGSFVLLGVHGVASEVPGVSGDPACWQQEVGVLWIPDAGDAIRCEEHSRLQAVARAFAEQFNRRLVEEYLRRTPSPCAAPGDAGPDSPGPSGRPRRGGTLA